VAAGTTVVRAIEGCCANHRGELLPGQGVTDLRIRPGFTPRIVQGILTGVHDHGTSHLELLGAFVPKALLAEAQRHAEKSGYLGHEFGDAMLALAA
jgi:S-adenosylmethionine:tRNA ribosyltransferase-isomerase